MQQLVSHLGPARGGRNVGFCVAGEHGGPELLSSTPEGLELLECPLEESLLVIVDGNDVLGVPDATRPRADLLHHDERDIAHDNSPPTTPVRIFLANLGRHGREMKAISAPELLARVAQASAAESRGFWDTKHARNPDFRDSANGSFAICDRFFVQLEPKCPGRALAGGSKRA